MEHDKLEEMIADLDSRYSHFEAREARAKDRAAIVKGSWWCFGLVGLVADFEEREVLPGIILRKIVEPPGEIELARAMKAAGLFSSIARYSHILSYELAIKDKPEEESQRAFTYAWWITSALRVRSLCDFLVPIVADRPWGTVAAVRDNSCHIQLLEDTPKAFRLEEGRKVSHDDIEWVVAHLLKFVKLLEHPSFRTAVEALTTHHQHASLRMAAAALWAGLEALLQIESELRFRVSTYVASLLEPFGPSRLSLFRHARKLYDVRSKAVHGAALEEAVLRAHVVEIRALLSRVICAITEGGRVPKSEQLDERVFDESVLKVPGSTSC